MKKRILGIIILLFIAVTIIFFYSKKRATNNEIIIGLYGNWQTLNPALMYTHAAGAILRNQFESLVQINKNGIIMPLAAKSYKVENNDRVYTFTIDTSRRFSNGEFLTAQHFKTSFETTLNTITQQAINNSARAYFYNIVGYEDFQNTKKLSGVTVINNETLKIAFKQPLRLALANLAMVHLSVYLKKEDLFLGTGAYVINKTKKETEVILTPNQYYPDIVRFNKITVLSLDRNLANDSLKQKKIHAYLFAQYTDISDCDKTNSNISCLDGQEERHLMLALTAQKNSLLSKSKYRLALQALLLNSLQQHKIPPYLQKNNFLIDNQFYLPLQKGRITQHQASEIIKQGEPYIEAFIAATHKRPLKIFLQKKHLFIKTLLEKEGITFSDDSIIFGGTVPRADVKSLFYDLNDYDVWPFECSIGSADPDILYHILGKEGTITSQNSYQPEIGMLLENGRSILEPLNVIQHYEKVTHEVLTHVPFIHLGYLKGKFAYRNDVIKPKHHILQRHVHDFNMLEPVR